MAQLVPVDGHIVWKIEAFADVKSCQASAWEMAIRLVDQALMEEAVNWLGAILLV